MSDAESQERYATDLVVAALNSGELKLFPSDAQDRELEQGKSHAEVQAQNLARAYAIVLETVKA